MAKAVNYGLAYGQSDFGLARALDIPRSRGAPPHRPLFRAVRHREAVHGRASSPRRAGPGASFTILGRKRPIPGLTARDYRVRSAAERVAQNTPMQGSGADIMKLAMLRVDRMLSERGFGAEMLLTVHDELVLEVDEAQADELGAGRWSTGWRAWSSSTSRWWSRSAAARPGRTPTSMSWSRLALCVRGRCSCWLRRHAATRGQVKQDDAGRRDARRRPARPAAAVGRRRGAGPRRRRRRQARRLCPVDIGGPGRGARRGRPPALRRRRLRRRRWPAPSWRSTWCRRRSRRTTTGPRRWPRSAATPRRRSPSRWRWRAIRTIRRPWRRPPTSTSTSRCPSSAPASSSGSSTRGAAAGGRPAGAGSIAGCAPACSCSRPRR